MSRLKKIVIGLLIMICSITLVCGGYIYSKLNLMSEAQDTNSSEEKTNELEIENKIQNILLAGVDGNNLDRGNRSDSMMILTVDGKNKNLRITSLSRDTYVDIKGHSTEKLTHAYAYDGPSLLLDTIKSNFDLDIDKYVTVNFNSFIKCIDLIGGVEVEVTDNDINMLNKYIDECYEYDRRKDKAAKEYINTSGKYNLNGYQALAFSRIRYQDSAFARDARQRQVVQACIKKLQGEGLEKTLEAIDMIMSGIKTNLTPAEIISITSKVLMIGGEDMKALQFPVYQNPATLKGKGWVIQWEKEPNVKVLHDFIFNNKEFNS